MLEFAISDLLKVVFILSTVFVLNTTVKSSIDKIQKKFPADLIVL